jgi:membrane-associated phospholipid phosphatase
VSSISGVKTHPNAWGSLPGRTGPVDPWDILVLDAPRDSPARRLARTFGGLHPAIVFAFVMLAGLATISLLSIGFGFFVTRVIEHVSSIGAADERVNLWLAMHRTPARTDASLVGSIIAGGVVLPIVAGVVGLVCVALRKWRIAAFIVFALAVESATYRATTLVVHSHRPRVVRLEHLPVDASYPSGHTAAALAVYGGLVLLLTSRFTSGVLRAAGWSFVLALVTFVGLARMYRGMHHPLDVAGGVLVGVAALIVVVFACRTADAAAGARSGHRAGSGGRE